MPTSLPSTFSAFQHRNYRIFYSAQLVSLIGSWMQNTAQGWLVVLLAAPGLAVGANATGEAANRAAFYLALVSIANSLPVFFGAIWGGVFADRYDKRRIILASQTALMTVSLSLAALVGFGTVEVWHVIVLAACSGLVNVFDIPARQSFVSQLVEKRELSNAIALNSAIFNAARAFGPALAGVLLTLLSGRGERQALALCFLANGVSFVGVLFALTQLRGDFAVDSDARRASPISQLREVGTYIWNNGPVRLLVGLVAMFSVFVVPYFVLLPSLARFTLNTDARQFGFILSCQGIGALAGALTVATFSNFAWKGRIMLAAGTFFPVTLFCLSLSRDYRLSCALVALTGFATISFISTANTLLQTSTPDALRGRLMGVYSFLLMGMTPVGSLWAGLVAARWGAPTAIAVGASCAFLVMLFVFLRFPAFRRMGRTLPEAL